MAAAGKPTLKETFASLALKKSRAMFVLGFAAGLPYALITGTLNAWFTNDDIDVKTIGVFSWIGILYAFKFLWSPAVDRAPTPRIFDMGQRRASVFILQVGIALALAVISSASPQTQLGLIAVAAIVCTFCSASQDILIDAWRIEVADERATVDLLSAVYQVGYRVAAILGGAGALIMSARIGWNHTFELLALLMIVAMSGVFIAEDGPTKPLQRGFGRLVPPARWRNLAITPVLGGWAWSFAALFGFMAFALNAPQLAKASAFTMQTGPLIILASIGAPVGAAAVMMRLAGRATFDARLDRPWPLQGAFDALYASVLLPLQDLLERLKWGAVIVLLLILSYRFTDLIWGSFAFPFYMGTEHGALGHTADEVAIASKVFGALMTFFGIAIGAATILRVGRMPCVLLGAILAASTNLLFADLARGGAATDAFMRALHLYPAFHSLQGLADFLTLKVTMNEKLAQLMMVIAAENLSVGFASAASVVYLSSIVNPKYAAVQYALLASLTMLVGSLGRGAIGEMIESDGYAKVFVLAAQLGVFAIVMSALEWWRQSRTADPNPASDAERAGAAEPADAPT